MFEVPGCQGQGHWGGIWYLSQPERTYHNQNELITTGEAPQKALITTEEPVFAYSGNKTK